MKGVAYLLLELLKNTKAVQNAAEIGSHLNASSHFGDLRCRLVDLVAELASESVLAFRQQRNGEHLPSLGRNRAEQGLQQQRVHRFQRRRWQQREKSRGAREGEEKEPSKLSLLEVEEEATGALQCTV